MFRDFYLLNVIFFGMKLFEQLLLAVCKLNCKIFLPIDIPAIVERVLMFIKPSKFRNFNSVNNGDKLISSTEAHILLAISS